MATVNPSVFTGNLSGSVLNYVLTHVFFPVILPKNSDYTPQNDLSLARAVCAAARVYSEGISDKFRPQWHRIAIMVENLWTSAQSERLDKDCVTSQLGGMKTGDILAYHLRSRNAAVILRKQDSYTLYESFEVSPRGDAVGATERSLVCPYPGPSIELPNTVFDDEGFQVELVNFLTQLDEVDPNPPNLLRTPSQYITALLTGILRTVGRVADVPRITKRVRDEIGQNDKGNTEWRRSPLWLLIRVAIQISLDRTPSGRALYKAFILFFICSLAIDANNAEVSSDLLHLMSTKILRRLTKLGASTPDWLSGVALKTCNRLQDTLEVRWASEQAAKPPSPPWNPSQLDLTRDSQLSLSHSHDYLQSILADPVQKPHRTPFHLKDHIRGTLKDFLSLDGSFFEEALRSNPYGCLFDVERLVEQRIDDWVIGITDMSQSCAELEVLMDKYLSSAHHMNVHPYNATPEHRSIMLLTALELWVALDRLAVKEIPILADYSPEVPVIFLEMLLLRKNMDLQRLSRVYRYLSSRHSDAQLGWSVLSDIITEDSFPVRYYDRSPSLQHLKVHIEAEAALTSDDQAQRGDGLDADHLPKRCENSAIEALQPILPSEPLHAKVFVFELQCPVLVRTWRSATTRLMHHFDPLSYGSNLRMDQDNGHLVLLSDIPGFQPYLAEHLRQRAPVSMQFHFACLGPSHSRYWIDVGSRYAFELPSQKDNNNGRKLCEWRQNCGHRNHELPRKLFAYELDFDFGSRYSADFLVAYENMNAYAQDTTHTPNKVLAAQVDCPENYSLHEYITFGHLRSGSAIQWINILRELRSRTLNIHREDFHFLLVQASSQIGPLNLDTGSWMLHEDLQEPTFCHAFLDELEGLFADVAVSSSDGIATNTISFLVTRLLASSPCEDVSEKAIRLLQIIRRKSFTWVKELSYNLVQAPTGFRCRQLLWEMATTCRSTCDIDLAILRKIVFAAEDIEALLSCGIFIHATVPISFSSRYPRIIHERDQRLAPILEVVLRDAILANVSDQGIDLAVRNVWPGYRPGDCRWKPLNSHWLTCQTSTTGNRRPQTVVIDLLDGSLLVDGQPLGGLPPEILGHPVYQQIFNGESFVVIPSSLPGMNFATLAMVSEHFVHFSVRGEDLVIQAQEKDSDVVLELIPQQKLKGDLPTILVECHIHWLNISTSTIEIRPFRSLWKHSLENWRVNCVPGKYCMYKAQEFLVDIRSPSWAMVWGRLGCLERSENLIVTTSTNDASPLPQLFVTLPRYGLSFFVNENGDLESRDFKEMVYDKDQHIGTLFGLENQLVLQSKVQVEGLVPKCVLIPQTNPFSTSKSHPDRVKYHAYKVDTELGCLTENAGLKSKMHLADLHEETSIDWRPDPLTGRTGVQEALSLLLSAGCYSIMDWDSGSSYCLEGVDIRNTHPYHPQIDIAFELCRQKQYKPKNSARLKRSASRETSLPPPSVAGDSSMSLFLKECDRDYVYSDVELGDVVYIAASAVHQSRRFDASVIDCLLRCAEVWGSVGSHDTMRRTTLTSRSPPSQDRIQWNPDLPRGMAIKVQEILQEGKTVARRFWPLFLLPVLAYCSPRPQVALFSLHTAFGNQSLSEDPLVSQEPWGSSLPRPVAPPQYTSEHVQWRITLDQLLHTRIPPELPARSARDPFLLSTSLVRKCDSSVDASVLHQLFTPLRMQTEPSFQDEYISRLHVSAQHVRKESYVKYEKIGNPFVEDLKNHFVQCRVGYYKSLDVLKQCLGPNPVSLERALERSGQWPRITADALLRCLASTSPIKLLGSWKKCLLSLALLLLDLQHARRLLRLALDGLEEEFYKELENEGCNEWCAEMYPDWLLIQIQGDFRIRSVQAEIAKEIISPESGKNTVMQVNMGEGKSSVIIPISAAALADGRQLVRIIVPKALTVQMFGTLVKCLGGLANRKIYHLPFSRALSAYEENEYIPANYKIDNIYKCMMQCMNDRGILVVQPEHILSLKLASVEDQLSEDERATCGRSPRIQKSIYERAVTIMSIKSLTKGSYVASMCQSFGNSFNRPIQNHLDVDDHDENPRRTLGVPSKSSELQQWLHSYARDIMDESDEILHTRCQLIYAIGLKEHMDGYPDRWTIIQRILRLVKKHTSSLVNDVPGAIEYEPGPPGSFPYIRILQGSDAGPRLVSLVVEDVMAGRLADFKFPYANPALQLAIRKFISREHSDPEEIKEVHKYVQRSQQNGLWRGLLLLRGLLASNILLFAFVERRWRVDYGLVPPSNFRTRGLSIPYRAKDVPADDTQFGHPDITILLTCLSYYYAGLSQKELKTCFKILQEQDNPVPEFATWIEDCERDSMPDSLRQLSDINLQSLEQWDKYIFPVFNRNQGAIDFYLSRVVFPREAKEFPWKISGTSWDLAEERERPITGFSGTADGRYLLPMSVSHYDLDHQQGTNAKVLACLLQRENDHYTSTTNKNGERCTTHELLEMIVAQDPGIRVLLDVGAQILDLSNREVARTWLRLASDAIGAIYFNEKDELMTLTKNGTTLPLISSPLAQQVDRCITYLDHAHTRGTDLKFPKGFRAAVTLGPRVTKDQLVQGCMRMRMLGHGHSVMFFAPPGVDRDIRFTAAKKDMITTADILNWAIRETLTDIQQRAYHWAQQGMDHRSRYDAWARFCRNELSPEKMTEAWLQPEYRSLAALYSPCETSNPLVAMDPDIRQRCIYLGGVKSSFRKVSLDEEQEREVSRQLEREREVELAPKAEPAEHSLHPDVVAFVTTGFLPSSLISTAFRPVFTSLEKSSAASREVQVWSPFILATEDFCRTVKPESTQGRPDQYLRPVQWVLSGFKGRNRVLVLLSPFEADRLMPAIRISKHVHLHLYLPRTTEQMKPSDDLKFYVIPPLPDDWTPSWDLKILIDQLNVFAGQLYLRDHESYLRLSQFLGITPTGTATATRRNLFIPGALEDIENTFVDSPLPCIMTLLNIRRRGLPFMDTHMGKILQGRTLTPKDFERPSMVAHDRSLKHATHDATLHPEACQSSRRRVEGADEISNAHSEPLSKRLWDD